MLEYCSEFPTVLPPRISPTRTASGAFAGGIKTCRLKAQSKSLPAMLGAVSVVPFFVAKRPIMQGSSKKILIVDDDVMILRLLRRLLGQEYCLAEANSGEEALAMLDRFAADLVLLDIVLPGIDGYETCRRIRAKSFGRAIQLLIVSARSSRGEQVRAYAAGADDYVVKPFDPYAMCSRVRLHFRLRGAWRPLPAPAVAACVLTPPARRRRPAPVPGHVHDVTAAALTEVAELRDTETGEHLVRMRTYSQIIAEELGCQGPYAEQIDERFVNDLYRASPLHDIGKVGIADAILLKPARSRPRSSRL